MLELPRVAELMPLCGNVPGSHTLVPLFAVGKNNPALLVAVALIVFFGCWGFYFMVKTLALDSVSFMLGIDLSTNTGIGVAAACAVFFCGMLYYLFYPEGTYARNIGDEIAEQRRLTALKAGGRAD